MAPYLLRDNSPGRDAVSDSESPYVSDAKAEATSEPTNLHFDLDNNKMEPVAIIGFSFRFPQEATSEKKFWRMLVEGRSARTKIPKERFDIGGLYHPDASRHDSLNVRDGHFLTADLAAFDAPFFSMTPTEAASLDPLQRGLLETTYRAFENAGITMEKAAGSNTSVHIGTFNRDWEKLILKDPMMHVKYPATGSEFSILSNRLSWFYDLTGPSMSIDTACSGSLTALHLACQCLLNREANMGVVGGANICLSPDVMISMANIGFLSPDGKCHSFDHRANGYARGEGFGALIIKRLSDALEDGDTIRGIIRASRCNQDGRTAGITQPKEEAQANLIQETYKAGGLSTSATRYFEAHGTGTQLGDPIEAGAVATVFGSQRSQQDPLYIGSVKSNIGHLEGASGIASLIKTILVLEKGLIPPTIWFERPNPRIPEKDWNLKFPTENIPWPASGLRRASVNSFGFGGSNVHVVLDDVYHYLKLHRLNGNHRTSQFPSTIMGSDETVPALVINSQKAIVENDCQELRPKLFVFSAADEGGAKRIASLYVEHLSKQTILTSQSHYLENLAYTLSLKRSSLPWKSYVVAKSLRELCQGLEDSQINAIRSSSNRKLGLVFTGQGAQWCGMGRELIEYPTFSESVHSAQAYIKTLGCTWSLWDELQKDEATTNVHHPAYSQPICTVLQIALSDLLQSWGLTPSAVVGHSSGEIAAAYSAGALSKKSALKVAFYRGSLAAKLASDAQGAMMSVGLSEEEALTFLGSNVAQCTDVVIGCVNSPRNVTLSGPDEQIDNLKAMLDRNDVFAKKLNVNIAYHSKAMVGIASEYQALISNITIREPSLGRPVMFSSVTGKRITIDKLSRAEYWVCNMVSKVRFSEALSQICSPPSRALGRNRKSHKEDFFVNDLLEIGPHSALRGSIRQSLDVSAHGKNISYSSLLIRGVPAIASSISAMGHIHCLGHKINFGPLNNPVDAPHSLQILTDLPEYPFKHDQSYWQESRLSRNLRFRKQVHHELLGTPLADWNPMAPVWRYQFRKIENPWIVEHEVSGLELYPAAGLLVMAIEAASQLADTTKWVAGYQITDVFFKKALIIHSRTDDQETQLHLRPFSLPNEKVSDRNEFRIYTYDHGNWAENCRGIISVKYQEENNEVDCGKETREEISYYSKMYNGAIQNCTTSIPSSQIYAQLEALGLKYGRSFQVLDNVRYGDREAVGTVKLRRWTSGINELHYQKHVVHPTALDGILQLVFCAIRNNSLSTMVPERIRNLWVSSQGLSEEKNELVKVYAQCRQESLSVVSPLILALDFASHEPRVVLQGLQMGVVEGHQVPNSAGLRRLCYSFDWKPDVDLLNGSEILAYCKALVPPKSAPDQLIEDVEFLCFSHISNALERMDNRSTAGQKPHFIRYIEWMKRQCLRYDAGELIHWRPEWRLLKRDKAYIEQTVSRIEDSSAQGRLYAETAKNLIPILEGQMDALDLLFSGELAADYYREANNFGTAAPYLDALAHKNPGLKILEIGAGTGGMTCSIFEVLSLHGTKDSQTSRFSEYVYTDISPGFFEKAKERFKDHVDRMIFKVLNIEKDPLQQGLLEEEYDLIVASNVLHATPNLSVTLQNTRKLLRPGGKLILGELFNDAVTRAHFTFGLLPGWWLGIEEQRHWSPLLSEKGWHAILEANGFSGVDVSFHDHDDLRNQLAHTIVSTAAGNLQGSRSFPKIVIVIRESTKLQLSNADQIKSQLESIGVSECLILSYEEISSTALQLRFVIFLAEVEAAFLKDIDKEDFGRLQIMIKEAAGLLWVTRAGGLTSENPEVDMVMGLSRCVRSEDNNRRFITLALESAETETVAKNVTKIVESTFYTEPEQCETEYEERDGRLCINRVVEDNSLNDFVCSKMMPQEAQNQPFEEQGRALTLKANSEGLLDSMEYVSDAEVELPLSPDEVEVKVKAVGVNFKDVLIALGRLYEGGLGNECAGVVTRVGSEADFVPGDRVCVCALGTYKTYVRSKVPMVFKIPTTMSYCEAAAFPVVYTTAYRALYENARLEAGESILIHSGAGGTGQAAIQLSRLLKAEIFVTVGTKEKKALVMELYDIPEDHIFSSRGVSFTKGVLRMTKGRGVDVVLNSLAGEALRGSWECLAPFGRFVEIGKKDILDGNNLPMLPFNENRTFAAVNLTHMISERPILIKKTMDAVMKLFRDGKLSAPQPLHIYSNTQLEDAFRYLQGGKNTGKTVVKFNEADIVSVVPQVQTKCSFQGEKSYIIAGGLGGLGKRIALWMANRGAKYLILLSRSGAVSEESIAFIRGLEAMGVNVKAPACDITDESVLAQVLAKCKPTFPPIKGCIQGSMVVQDSLFEQMSWETFNMAVKPKVDGSWNLHKLLPQGLEFFILLSSTSGVGGVRGQASYAAGNTYQDALARHRVARGEKAVSLDLGVIMSVGYVAERPQVFEAMKTLGYLPIHEAELLALLDFYCDPALEILSPSTCQSITGLETPASMRAQKKEEAYWMRKCQFKALHQIDAVESSLHQADVQNTVNLSSLLSSAGFMVEAVDIISESLARKLSKILSMPLENIESTKPMHVFGVDSLVAVEIRNWYKKELNTDVVVLDILSNRSITDLNQDIARKSKYCQHLWAEDEKE
ncbi:MAG: hypothetical protein MMC33_008943 [Icmadophila ericetorum]|nr:hypothetical protein [Icmadophila ericetorum]